MAVTRDGIVGAALGILDQYGLADLSMRRIGDALGVQAATIYWHYANKQTLLAGVSDEILAAQSVPDVVGVDAAMCWWARDLRRVLLAHRDAAELVAATLAIGLGQRRPQANLVQVLVGADWSPDAATGASGALTHFVLGHVMQEQTRANLLELGVLQPPTQTLDDAGFELGLQIWARGLACRVV